MRAARVALVLLVALAAGCASFSDGAHLTTGLLGRAGYTATKAWQAHDKAEQDKLVAAAATRAEAEAKLAEHRTGAPRKKAVEAIQAARHALGILTAVLAAYDANAAKPEDVNAAIAEAIKAGRELLAVLKAIGVNVPEVLLP